jgi:hypothetical protein
MAETVTDLTFSSSTILPGSSIPIAGPAAGRCGALTYHLTLHSDCAVDFTTPLTASLEFLFN